MIEDLLDSPARIGFGKDTTGGAGGTVYHVTNLNNSGTGSLRDAVSKSGRWVVFDISGTFKPSSKIKVASNVTIDGRGQLVTIEKNGLDIAGRDNVIVHNLYIRKTAIDAIGVWRSTNVWIDHCTLENCGDGLLDVTAQSHGVTASWCHLKNHNKCMLVGANDSETADAIISLTVHHCHFDHTIRRNPFLRFGRVHLFNNVWREWGSGATGGDCINSTLGGQTLVENSIFIAGANKKTMRVTIPNYTEVEGFIKSRGNLALNGALLDDHLPERVFEASDFYPYSPETVGQALIDQVTAGAGRIS